MGFGQCGLKPAAPWLGLPVLRVISHGLLGQLLLKPAGFSLADVCFQRDRAKGGALLTCCAEKCRGEALLLTCCAEICNLLVQLFAESFDFMTRCLTTNFTCVFANFRLRRSKRQIYGNFTPWRGTSKRQS